MYFVKRLYFAIKEVHLITTVFILHYKRNLLGLSWWQTFFYDIARYFMRKLMKSSYNIKSIWICFANLFKTFCKGFAIPVSERMMNGL